MVNQQKVDTAYSAVVVNVSPSLPICIIFSTPLGQKRYRDGDTSLELHYLLFADLPSLSPWIYIPVPLFFLR